MTSDQVEIFFGEANPAVARVYARLVLQGREEGWQLSGRVVGPYCAWSHTLPAASRLVPKPSIKLQGAGRRPQAAENSAPVALLAEAVVPDPCFWSPDLPFLYQVHVDLHQGDRWMDSVERPLGIRPLATAGRRLMFAAQGWVLRAVDVDEVPAADPEEWRQAATAMSVNDPDDDLCLRTSRLGVLVVARLRGDPGRLADGLRRLAKWPSVVMAAVGRDVFPTALEREGMRNLLVAEEFGPPDDVRPAGAADVAVCEDDSAVRLAERAGGCRLPVVARRPAGPQLDLASARGHCDRLQRELAGLGDFAGYLV